MSSVGTTPRTVSKAVSTLRSATALQNREAPPCVACNLTRGPQTNMGRGWNPALHVFGSREHGRHHSAKAIEMHRGLVVPIDWRARFHPRPNQSRASSENHSRPLNAYRSTRLDGTRPSSSDRRFGSKPSDFTQGPQTNIVGHLGGRFLVLSLERRLTADFVAASCVKPPAYASDFH